MRKKQERAKWITSGQGQSKLFKSITNIGVKIEEDEFYMHSLM